jgi:beta-galactosidase
LNLSKFQKGYVWVNGHNLGRYWNIGPTHNLFCPGAWLKIGKNTITILDMLNNKTEGIWGTT